MTTFKVVRKVQVDREEASSTDLQPSTDAKNYGCDADSTRTFEREEGKKGGNFISNQSRHKLLLRLAIVRFLKRWKRMEDGLF